MEDRISPVITLLVMIPLKLREAVAEIDGDVSKMRKISSLQKYTSN
jgi:hypothetical protein